MFEVLCIRPQDMFGVGGGLDLGLVAESLLFYEEVHLICNRAIVTALYKAIGFDGIQRLVRTANLRLHYLNQMTGVVTEGDRHAFRLAEMPHTRIRTLLPELLEHDYAPGKARRLSRSIMREVSEDHLESSITSRAFADVCDQGYVAQAVRTYLTDLVPTLGLPSEIEFACSGDEDGFRVETNLDLRAATAALRAEWNTDIEVTSASILAALFRILEDISYAAATAAEMAVPIVSSNLISLRCAPVVSTRLGSEGNIARFTNVIVDGADIRRAVNEGRLAFMDVVEVSAKGTRFRDWTTDLEPDAELVREYVATNSASTAAGLTRKSLRWAVVTTASTGLGLTVAGPLGVLGGVAIGLGDAISAEIRNRWRPNQFVEASLRPLLGRALPET